jgi:hypothetical protein
VAGFAELAGDVVVVAVAEAEFDVVAGLAAGSRRSLVEVD